MSDDLFSIFMSMDDTPVKRNELIRAPFGWAGSKWRSLENILPHLPYRKLYCEPFGGSGAVLLSRNESKLEIFNDRFSGVVAFYRCIRDKDKLQPFLDRMELTIHSREEFVWARDTWKNCEDEIERAARWYYSVLMSFSQRGRDFGRSVDSSGQMGKRLRSIPKLLGPVHSRIRNVQFENLDWRQCFKDYDHEDMVWYLDPPYYDYSKGIYEHELSNSDHREFLERIQSLKGFVALSGYYNELYTKYKWDRVHSWEVRDSVQPLSAQDENNDHRRGKATEVLWIKD